MEKKRTWLRSNEEEEEDDYRKTTKRISLRERRKITYFENVKFDFWSDEEEDDEDDDDEEDNQMTQENELLSVTCGTKKGIMDIKKLERGEACIEYEGCWYAPPAFEDLAGKGSAKKWKATIFCCQKPLQFWFEQGSLSTKGYKKRGLTKAKKIPASDSESENLSEASEVQSVEETEEDNVQDEDQLPSSKELAMETEQQEKESVGAEKKREVLNSGDGKSEEEEDKMECEDINHTDNSGIKERATKCTISPEKLALPMKEVKLIIAKLPEMWSNSQTSCMECNGSATDAVPISAAALSPPSQMSDPSTSGNVQEDSDEDFAEGDERKQGQGVSTSLGIVNETEDTGSTNVCTASLNTCTVSLVPVAVASFSADTTGGWEDRKDEQLQSGNEKEQNESKVTGNICDVTSNTAICVKKELTDQMSELLENQKQFHEGKKNQFQYVNTNFTGPPFEPLTVLDEREDINVPFFGHTSAEVQEVKSEMRVSQTSQTSDCIPSSYMMQAPSFQSSAASDLDTMDLNQLKREKIKIQLKVLKLQEEYYTLKISELKK